MLEQNGKRDMCGRPGNIGELKLPTEVVSSEFLTMEGKKFTSSKGVVIYVRDMLERYQPDALRYYICAAGPENQDADFTWVDFVTRTNNELVARSEEHTSELQSRGHLVCRLLLEKKKQL